MYIDKKTLKKIQNVKITDKFLKTPEAQRAIEKGEEEGLE